MEENKENNENKKNMKLIGIITAVAILAIIVIIAIGLILYNKGIIGNKIAKVIGYYELYEMSSNDQFYSNEEISELINKGLKVTLELREDKTGTIDLFGEAKELTFDTKNITIDEDSSPYSFKDEKLSMEDDGDKLVFQKIEKPEETNK